MLRRLSKGLSVECDAFVAIDAVYRPCNPEENPLYGVIAGHLETFLARQRERDRNVPGFVEKMWTSTARQRFRKQSFESLHAGLERFLRGSWRRAKLEKKSDAISRVARSIGKIGEMSLYR